MYFKDLWPSGQKKNQTKDKFNGYNIILQALPMWKWYYNKNLDKWYSNGRSISWPKGDLVCLFIRDISDQLGQQSGQATNCLVNKMEY